MENHPADGHGNSGHYRFCDRAFCHERHTARRCRYGNQYGGGLRGPFPGEHHIRNLCLCTASFDGNSGISGSPFYSHRKCEKALLSWLTKSASSPSRPKLPLPILRKLFRSSTRIPSARMKPLSILLLP